jgi:hypothetical protein
MFPVNRRNQQNQMNNTLATQLVALHNLSQKMRAQTIQKKMMLDAARARASTVPEFTAPIDNATVDETPELSIDTATVDETLDPLAIIDKNTESNDNVLVDEYAAPIENVIKQLQDELGSDNTKNFLIKKKTDKKKKDKKLKKSKSEDSVSVDELNAESIEVESNPIINDNKSDDHPPILDPLLYDNDTEIEANKNNASLISTIGIAAVGAAIVGTGAYIMSSSNKSEINEDNIEQYLPEISETPFELDEESVSIETDQKKSFINILKNVLKKKIDSIVKPSEPIQESPIEIDSSEAPSESIQQTPIETDQQPVNKNILKNVFRKPIDSSEAPNESIQQTPIETDQQPVNKNILKNVFRKPI